MKNMIIILETGKFTTAPLFAIMDTADHEDEMSLKY